MKFWQIEVFVTLGEKHLYTIEAETAEEALELARIGDTIEEETLETIGVNDRNPDADTLQEIEEAEEV